MALVLRIKFPPTYPLIYKTLRIDKNFTVAEGIDFISETLHVAAGENIGLYLPAEKQWLDKNTPLKEYPQLEEVEEVEFKDKNETQQADSGSSGSASGGCCVIS